LWENQVHNANDNYSHHVEQFNKYVHDPILESEKILQEMLDIKYNNPTMSTTEVQQEVKKFVKDGKCCYFAKNHLSIHTQSAKHALNRLPCTAWAKFSLSIPGFTFSK